MKQKATAFGPALLAGMGASAVGLPDSGILLVVLAVFIVFSIAGAIIILVSVRRRSHLENRYALKYSIASSSPVRRTELYDHYYPTKAQADD